MIVEILTILLKATTKVQGNSSATASVRSVNMKHLLLILVITPRLNVKLAFILV